ncbi:hypothetical protein GO491_00685 [Flavobacteriaceae bacterium Ap0902]|nr:hypothetical protein [Flavobacteriaceae bacterium Ap0902]
MLIGTLTFASTGEVKENQKESKDLKADKAEEECVMFEYTCGLDGMACGATEQERLEDAVAGDQYFCG